MKRGEKNDTGDRMHYLKVFISYCQTRLHMVNTVFINGSLVKKSWQYKHYITHDMKHMWPCMIKLYYCEVGSFILAVVSTARLQRWVLKTHFSQNKNKNREWWKVKQKGTLMHAEAIQSYRWSPISWSNHLHLQANNKPHVTTLKSFNHWKALLYYHNHTFTW
jgi:hypothetical protein